MDSKLSLEKEQEKLQNPYYNNVKPNNYKGEYEFFQIHLMKIKAKVTIIIHNIFKK